MYYFLGQLIGSIIGVFLFRALFMWVFKFIKNPKMRIYAAHSALAVFMIVVSALGNADGGPLAWESGLFYLPIQGLFLAHDLMMLSKVEEAEEAI